ARERHGGHSRRGRNWQAKIFRHPMLQEQQADHDAQDTQHTWGPRCEKAVDRRHHNFSYERPKDNISIISLAERKAFTAKIVNQNEAVEAAKRNGGNGCRQNPAHDLRPEDTSSSVRTPTAKGPLSGDALQTPISGLPEIGA